MPPTGPLNVLLITTGRKPTHYAGLHVGELYDMTAGVPEARNLYDAPAWAADRARLEKHLLDDSVLSHGERLKPTCHI